MDTMNNGLSGFDSALILITAALFFSLLIERLVELIKAVYDYLEVTTGWSDHWNRAAQRLVHELEQQSDSRLRNELGKAIEDYLSDDVAGVDGLQAVSADKVRKLTLQVIVRILAMLMGITVALLLDINLFDLLQQLNQAVARLNGETRDVSVYFASNHVPDWLGVTLSGLAMGLGSDPLHQLISRMEKARKNRTNKAETGVSS